jgi:hypothetical protein
LGAVPPPLPSACDPGSTPLTDDVLTAVRSTAPTSSACGPAAASKRQWWLAPSARTAAAYGEAAAPETVTVVALLHCTLPVGSLARMRY